MKRENYVAPRIKVLEIGQELLDGGTGFQTQSPATMPIDPTDEGSHIVHGKEDNGNWSDEDNSTPVNSWDK